MSLRDVRWIGLGINGETAFFVWKTGFVVVVVVARSCSAGRGHHEPLVWPGKAASHSPRRVCFFIAKRDQRVSTDN